MYVSLLQPNLKASQPHKLGRSAACHHQSKAPHKAQCSRGSREGFCLFFFFSFSLLLLLLSGQRLCIIDAHYRRHCQLQTLRPGGQHCQVNVSPTSGGGGSQNASAQAAVMNDADSPARRLSPSAPREVFFVLLNLLPDAPTAARSATNV